VHLIMTKYSLMQHREKIVTKDGQEIAISIFRPSQVISKVLIIGADVITSQKTYEKFASYIASQGCVVYTFDYRGVGQSLTNELKTYNASLNQWGFMDLDAVILHAKHHFPKHELDFMAHGTSGQLLGLSPASQYLNNAIFINTSLTCWRFWPWYAQFKISTLKVITPILSKLFGYFPGSRLGLNQDLPSGVTLELYDWCSRPNGLFDFFPDSNFRKIQIPILVYSFTDDWFAPELAVKALLSHYNQASISWMHLKPSDVGKKSVGHSGFFLDKNKATFWEFIAEWMSLSGTIKAAV